MRFAKIKALQAARLPGHSLPQGLYDDPEAFASERVRYEAFITPAATAVQNSAQSVPAESIRSYETEPDRPKR